MPADIKLSSINNSNIKSKLLQKDDFELPSPGVKGAKEAKDRKASTTQIEVINNYNNNNNFNNNKEDNNIKIDEFDDQFDH